MNKQKKWRGLIAVLLLAGIAGVILAVRRSGDSEKSPVFLPGIYTCLAQNEFCEIADTLTIRRTKNTSDDYILTRATSFIRVRSGKRDPPEFQQRHWIGHYDLKGARLVPVEDGDTVRYYGKLNQVSQSAFYYEKIE